MHRKRLPPLLAVALTVAGSSGGAHALGLGEAPGGVVLGEPLDFVVPLLLDAADGPPPDCASAKVRVAEQPLGPGDARARVERVGDAARVRVATSSRIGEPVVTVELELGCPPRLARRYVLFADPPSLAPPRATPPPAVVGVAPARQEARSPAPPRPAARTSDRMARPAGRDAQADRADARAARPAASPAPAARRARLQLEPPAAVAAPAFAASDPVDEALAAVAQATTTVRAAAAAASAAEQRVAALEADVAGLRAEAQRQRAAAAELHSRLAAAERAGRAERAERAPMLLASASLVLLVLAGWLARRVRALERERRDAWRQAAAQADPGARTTVQIPVVTSELPGGAAPRAAASRFVPFTPLAPPPQPAPPPPGRPDRASAPVPQAAAPAAGAASTAQRAKVPAEPVQAPVQAPMQAPVQAPEPARADDPPAAPTPVERTQVLPAQSLTAPARDVSIEELIDLEQQAEFFVVLGQDDAAIDLLMDHLRGTGGGSPLPYLKLLEIYRRRGDRPAYERIRERFHNRFNGYAPAWDSELNLGRALEDYPGVLARLEQVWPRPLDAMAELEALLFRRSRGELFDLPAYREVLFLYSLARDLLDREATAPGSVDVLLPLADRRNAGAAASEPGSGGAETGFGAASELEGALDRPTAPLDLDLSRPETGSDAAASLFGPGPPRGA